MHRLLLAVVLLLWALPAQAQNVYATLNPTGTAVTGIFANPQPQLPGYAILSASDSRVAAFQAAQAVAAAAQQALAQGVPVTSTGMPSLSGTYALDATSQSNVQAVALYIEVNAKFPGGAATLPWADASGAIHVFASTAEYLSFASALASYVAEIEMYRLGQAPALPAQPVTIP